ncbi:MAG: hypothetical protein ABSD57_01490 [Verrucomicrobiota bacterium]|jgi:hypothetical protein
MQIPKLFSAVCVVAFCASCIAVQAEEDTLAQATARAALEKKIRELDAQQTQPSTIVITPFGTAVQEPIKISGRFSSVVITPSGTVVQEQTNHPASVTIPPAATTAPPPAKNQPPTSTLPKAQPAAPAPKTMPAPNTKAKAVALPSTTVTNAPVVTTAPLSAPTPSGATQAQPGQPTNVVVVPSPAVHAQPAGPVPETKPMSSTGAVQTTPATSDAEAQAKARTALDQKMSELNQQNWATPAAVPAASPAPQTQPVAISPVKPAPPAVKPEVMSPANQINANFPGKELGLKPIQAPPLPISAAKEAQLQALLGRYKADQITPEQYHTERAKILAEP